MFIVFAVSAGIGSTGSGSYSGPFGVSQSVHTAGYSSLGANRSQPNYADTVYGAYTTRQPVCIACLIFVFLF